MYVYIHYMYMYVLSEMKGALRYHKADIKKRSLSQISRVAYMYDPNVPPNALMIVPQYW